MKRYRDLSELPTQIQQLVAEGRVRATGLMCPECEGGAQRERSLGVYRIDNELVLKCYRMKCGFLGKLWLLGGPRSEEQRSGFEPRPALFDMHIPSADALAFMQRRYRLEADTLLRFGVKEVFGLRALYLPVYGPVLAQERGGVLRRFDGWGQKADSYKTADEPWQAWYGPRNAGTVLVEDQLSAMRAWQLGWNAVALLGAEVSIDRAVELTKHASPPIVLALDADAFSEACHIAKRHSWIDRVVLLRDDIKDASDAEIVRRLNA